MKSFCLFVFILIGVGISKLSCAQSVEETAANFSESYYLRNDSLIARYGVILIDSLTYLGYELDSNSVMLRIDSAKGLYYLTKYDLSIQIDLQTLKLIEKKWG
jgi:hypothetical protein